MCCIETAKDVKLFQPRSSIIPDFEPKCLYTTGKPPERVQKNLKPSASLSLQLGKLQDRTIVAMIYPCQFR